MLRARFEVQVALGRPSLAGDEMNMQFIPIFCKNFYLSIAYIGIDCQEYRSISQQVYTIVHSGNNVKFGNYYSVYFALVSTEIS